MSKVQKLFLVLYEFKMNSGFHLPKIFFYPSILSALIETKNTDLKLYLFILYWSVSSLRASLWWESLQNRLSSAPIDLAFLLRTSGGSCRWSPTRTKRSAWSNGAKQAGWAICEASSTMHTSNLAATVEVNSAWDVTARQVHPTTF